MTDDMHAKLGRMVDRFQESVHQDPEFTDDLQMVLVLTDGNYAVIGHHGYEGNTAILVKDLILAANQAGAEAGIGVSITDVRVIGGLN